MRNTIMFGIALASAGAITVAAQQSPPRTGSPTSAAPSADSGQRMTITGCVSSITGSQGQFMVSNPVVVGSAQSSTGAPDTTRTPPSAGAGAAAAGAPPPGATSTPPATTPPPTGSTTRSPESTGGNAAGGAGTTTPPPAGTPPTGAGTAGAPGSAGNAGRTPGTPSSPGAAGATASAQSGAAASGATTTNGYRLSGSDLSQWSGKRVEIVGTMVPAASASRTTSGPSNLPEFRVQSVRPTGGSCS